MTIDSCHGNAELFRVDPGELGNVISDASLTEPRRGLQPCPLD
jgi:hypothetical protein